MSERGEQSRAAMRSRVRRLVGTDPHERVDGSSFIPPEPLNADVQTGMRPVSRQYRKAGGKVHGKEAHKHAGRKPRKAGGRLVDEFVNRDYKEANEERPGIKHECGLKRGGVPTDGRARARKLLGGPNVGDLVVPRDRFGFVPARGSAIMGGSGLKKGGKVHSDEAQDKKLIKATVDKDCLKRKSGGRTKEKCAGGSTYANGGKIRLAKDPLYGGTAPEGGRVAHKKGGQVDRKSYGGEEDEGGYFSGAPRTAPDKHIIRALKEHGFEHSYKNGVLHGHMPSYDRAGNPFTEHVPIGNSVHKLKGFLGYKEGGSVGDHWIAGATKNKGALHRKLHVPEGEKIPAKKLAKAEHSKNPTERKEANLAKTLKRMHHANGGQIADRMKMGQTVEKPLAAKGLTSYRARGPYGHIAIGATDHNDALREARRSNPSIERHHLDVWNGSHYEPIDEHKGGRAKRANGGKAKGKTDINIVIAPSGGQAAQPPMPMPPKPPAAIPMPPPPPQGANPGGIPMPMGNPPGGPPPPPMMPRKRGGRTYKDMEAGSGSGVGRLEKTDIQEHVR